ncbi:MAG: acyl-CoA thioesterase [Beutenbergiaceae bacterium]
MGRLSVPVQIRWSDVDGYGHVNNAALLTLLEEARIAAFWNADVAEDVARPSQMLAAGVDAEHHTLVARQEIEYRAPLPFSQRPVLIELWIARMGGASLEVHYQVFSPDGVLCALAASTIVMVDAATGKPRRLTSQERGALHDLVDEPIEFRRRG